MVSLSEYRMPPSKMVHRVPQFVGENRFGNWLASARDWNISRNRYWGTPIPLWASEDYEEVTIPSTIRYFINTI
jgi:isoleucyl-tRNA synthetase